jgi:hypothetical protein
MLKMKIKNWSEFQHFKDRTPPWIKLYRYLLDDPDWHELSGDDAKTLIMLWLVASEDKDMQGSLPSLKNIAFRLRISETKLNQSLTKLSHWLITDDIDMISNVYQHDAPETEEETETKYIPPISKDLLNEWMKIRRKKKAGDVTEIVYNSIKREADKAGWTVEQAITRCCERSWVGFEAEWVKSEIVKPREVRLSL